jgi:hypothetical protein
LLRFLCARAGRVAALPLAPVRFSRQIGAGTFASLTSVPTPGSGLMPGARTTLLELLPAEGEGVDRLWTAEGADCDCHPQPTSGPRCADTLQKDVTLGPLETESKVTPTLFRLATSGRNPAATVLSLKFGSAGASRGKLEEQEAPSNVVWRIREYQPFRSPEDQKRLDEELRGFDESGAPTCLA